jgi:hypothetical protein
VLNGQPHPAPPERVDAPVAACSQDHQPQIAKLNADFAAGRISYEEMTARILRVMGA